MLERQRERIAKAKSEGKYRGRTPTLQRQADTIRAMRAVGKKPKEIAKELKVARSGVYRMLAPKGAKEPADEAPQVA